MPTWPISEFHRLFDSGFAPSAHSLRLKSWSHAWHDPDGGNAVYLFCVIVFWTKGRLLPIFTCIFGLSETYFGNFARLALVRSRTPMILCLSNARSGEVHFGVSFVALRALVREIIQNTIHTHIHTYIHTWPKSDFHRLFDSGFAPSALSLRLNYISHHAVTFSSRLGTARILIT